MHSKTYVRHFNKNDMKPFSHVIIIFCTSGIQWDTILRVKKKNPIPKPTSRHDE